MSSSDRRSYPTGFVFGVVVALAFALVISLLPAALFEERGLLALALLLGALAAPPTVWLVWAVANWRRTDPTITLLAAGTGAITFDGLGIAFIPGLYGQTGQALAGVGAMLLFAFASLAVAGYVMTRRASVEAHMSN